MSRLVSLGMDLGRVGSMVSGLYMGFACTVRWVSFELAHHLIFWAKAINSYTFMAILFESHSPFMDRVHLGWTWYGSSGQVMFLNKPLDVLVESDTTLMFNRAFYIWITELYGFSIIPEWLGI